MKNLIIAFVLVVGLISCNQNNSSNGNSTNKEIAEAYKNYQSDPSETTATEYINEVIKEMQVGENDEIQLQQLLEQAIFISEKEQLNISSATLISAYLKRYPNSNNHQQYCLSLIEAMEELGKKDAATSLKTGYIFRFPNSDEAKKFQEEINFEPTTPAAYVKNKGLQIFTTNNPKDIDPNMIFQYVDAIEAIVMLNPNYPESPDLLMKAAEVSKITRTYKKSLALYDWIIVKYPDSPKAPLALFLKALMLDDDLNNIELAGKYYQEFIDKYPDHSFADDAKFSLENLGKSDAEIQEYLENLNKQNSEAN